MTEWNELSGDTSTHRNNPTKTVSQFHQMNRFIVVFFSACLIYLHCFLIILCASLFCDRRSRIVSFAVATWINHKQKRQKAMSWKLERVEKSENTQAYTHDIALINKRKLSELSNHNKYVICHVHSQQSTYIHSTNWDKHKMIRAFIRESMKKFPSIFTTVHCRWLYRQSFYVEMHTEFPRKMLF